MRPLFASIAFIVLLSISLAAHVGLPAPLGLHDFHVSKCLVEYRPQYSSIQITIHLFVDDLELALEQQGKTDLFIASERETADAESAVEAYIREHFSISVNSQQRQYEWIGKEPADDLMGIWCYMEISEVEKPTSLSVTNDLLMEVYSDQKNIVAFAISESEQGYLLFDEGNQQQSVQFN